MIQYLHKKVSAPKAIQVDEIVTLGKGCPFICYRKNLVAELKRSRESHEDDPRSERPVTVAFPK